MGLLNIIRRMHLRQKLSIREIAPLTGVSRNTVTKHLAANTIEPKFAMPERQSKIDPFAEKRKRCADHTLATPFQGSRSSIWLCLWPLTMAVSVFSSHAWGSTAFILQVSISEAMTAQFSAPASWPANRAFFLFSAMGRMVRLKWSGKFRQRAKMYPALTTGYRNDDKTQFFGQVQGHGCA
jgi:hypothetical protein